MAKEETMKAIDIKLDRAEEGIVAFYRITSESKEFLQKCEEKYGIIGFEYDGSFNFGVILKREN